jgi:hypothetical protein
MAKPVTASSEQVLSTSDILKSCKFDVGEGGKLCLSAVSFRTKLAPLGMLVAKATAFPTASLLSKNQQLSGVARSLL